MPNSPTSTSGSGTVPFARGASRCSASSDLSKVRKEITCLRAVRQQFRAFDDDGSGDISPDELALCWARAAASNYGRPLRPAELALIAARVERTFVELDVRRTARIDVHEWLHCALMERYSPGPAAAAAIAERIRAEDDERTIPRLLEAWSKADTDGQGMVLREVIPQLELKRPLQDELMGAMNKDAAPDLSYAEFCAQRLGLRNRRVELYLYDLSKSLASYLSPILVGHTEEGIWHSGVVVFGHEYYYYGTICSDAAGKTPFGTPTKVLQLGCTLRTEGELLEFLEERDSEFQPHLYDALEHNCNHLADDVVSFLLGRHIPNSVRLMSDRLRGALVVKALRPVLNRVLGNREDTRPRSQKGRPSVSGKTTTETTAPSSKGVKSSLTSLLSCVLGSDAVDLVLAEVPDCCEPVAAHVLQVHDGDGAYDLAWFDDTGHFRVTADVPRADVRPLHEKGTQEGFFRHQIYETALNSLQEAASSLYRPSLTILEEETTTELAAASEPCRSVCPRGHALQAARPRCWQGRVKRRPCGRCGAFIPRVDVRLRCDTCNYHLCEHCYERPESTPRRSTKCRPSLVCAGGGTPVLCPKGHQMQQFSGQAMCGTSAYCSICGQEDLGATAPYFYSCRLCLHSVCADCQRRSHHNDLARGWNGRLKQMTTLLASRKLLMRSGSDWSKVSSV